VLITNVVWSARPFLVVFGLIACGRRYNDWF
jgi:hypothetical protein